MNRIRVVRTSSSMRWCTQVLGIFCTFCKFISGLGVSSVQKFESPQTAHVHNGLTSTKQWFCQIKKTEFALLLSGFDLRPLWGVSDNFYSPPAKLDVLKSPPFFSGWVYIVGNFPLVLRYSKQFFPRLEKRTLHAAILIRGQSTGKLCWPYSMCSLHKLWLGSQSQNPVDGK